MLPLVVNVDILQVGLPSECEAFCDVASGHQHVFIFFDTLDILDVGINQFFVQLNVLKLGGYVHYVKYTVGNVMVYIRKDILS